MNRPPLRSILYVEDNANIRTLAKIALERLGGFSLHVCESGAEALAAIEAGMQPDLLLLDVMLPGMDGPTILEHLRRLPQTAQTPVIFMTAKVQSSEIAHFMSLGALGVITKPFQPTLLSQEIMKLWNGETPVYRAPAGMETTVDAFRARFLKGLPKQLADLASLSQRMESAPSAEEVSSLYRLLHGLSGMAGTFGFGELGDRARQVEEMVQNATASAKPGENLPAIAGALRDFLQWCKTAVPEASPGP
jgi:CheY-like chemotaxis protein